MATEFPVNNAIVRLRWTHPDGMLTRDAIAFLIAMFNRIGGANSPSIPAIIEMIEGINQEQSSLSNSANAEMMDNLVALTSNLQQQQAAIQATVHEIQKQIDGIRQGYAL